MYDEAYLSIGWMNWPLQIDRAHSFRPFASFFLLLLRDVVSEYSLVNSPELFTIFFRGAIHITYKKKTKKVFGVGHLYTQQP